MYSNWLMRLWLTNSSNKKSWITATVVLFNTQVKTNILAWWWIMMMHGCITTMKWWNKLTCILSWTLSLPLGFKLGKSWEAYVTKLPKMPWTSIYLASLKLDVFQQGDDLQSGILYALYYGQNGLKWKDFGDQQETIECPERVVRKDQQPVDLDLIINDIQNKLCF